LLEEDYFSRDGVEVRNSLVDVPVNWPACKTTEVRFVAPDQNNYLLEPKVLASGGFDVSLPEWAHLSDNGHTPSRLAGPGIFSNPVRLLEDRPKMTDANPEKILKVEFTK
jgi:hypothetical protein